MQRLALTFAVACIGVTLTACGSSNTTTAPSQRHLLVPWTSVGDITLGATLKQLHSEYGAEGGYGYRLHGGTVDVEANMPPINHVNWIYFTTPYYRTKSGFGIGSKIPLGACVKTWTHTCGHRWHGFVWDEVYKAEVCSCWVKVGTGKKSLEPSVSTFGKPWVILNVKHGRVRSIVLSSKYVD